MIMSKENRLKIGRENRRVARVNEILDLLQEECAEVIQAISKCRRFGLDEERANLVQEIGDVTLLVELLKAFELYNDKELRKAQMKKSKKLSKYSRIYD